MKFREHKGQQWDSMQTVVELPDNLASTVASYFTKLLRVDLPEFPEIAAAELECQHYPRGPRGWADQYIISAPGYGVIGFTDAPLSPEKTEEDKHGKA